MNSKSIFGETSFINFWKYNNLYFYFKILSVKNISNDERWKKLTFNDNDGTFDHEITEAACIIA